MQNRMENRPKLNRGKNGQEMARKWRKVWKLPSKIHVGAVFLFRFASSSLFGFQAVFHSVQARQHPKVGLSSKKTSEPIIFGTARTVPRPNRNQTEWGLHLLWQADLPFPFYKPPRCVVSRPNLAHLRSGRNLQQNTTFGHFVREEDLNAGERHSCITRDDGAAPCTPPLYCHASVVQILVVP